MQSSKKNLLPVIKAPSRQEVRIAAFTSAAKTERMSQMERMLRKTYGQPVAPRLNRTAPNEKILRQWDDVLSARNQAFLREEKERFRGASSILSSLRPITDINHPRAHLWAGSGASRRPWKLPTDVKMPLPSPVVLLRSSFLIALDKNGMILPNRQQIERGKILLKSDPTTEVDISEIHFTAESALMPVDEIERLHAEFLKRRPAQKAGHDDDDGTFRAQPDALPIVAVSYKWRTRPHPDPDGKTLHELAKMLDHEIRGTRDASGVVSGYSHWGYDDVGVFVDYCSLYQKCHTQDDGTRFYDDDDADGKYVARQEKDLRTPLSQKKRPWFEKREHAYCFKLALPTMCAWFSHMSTMVYAIVRIHNDTEYNHKLTPCCYEGAGWPFFEYNVAHWCKEEQTEMSYTLSNGQMASFWQMISFASDGDAGALNGSFKDTGSPRDSPPMKHHGTRRRFGGVMFSGAQNPPMMSPSRMESALDEKTFTNNHDPEMVKSMYRTGLMESLESRERMVFVRQGWGAEQAKELCETLSECEMLSQRGCACPRLAILVLSHNALKVGGITHVADLLSQGRLPALEKLELNNTEMGDAGLKALIDGLLLQKKGGANKPSCPKLRVLDLGANELTCEGVKAVEELLPRAVPQCTHLLLQGNNLRANGMILFAQLAHHMTKLKVLDITRQKVEGLKKADSLEVRRSMQSVGLKIGPGMLGEKEHLGYKWVRAAERAAHR